MQRNRTGRSRWLISQRSASLWIGTSRGIRLLLSCLILVWMIVIFMFSSQSGEASMQTSGFLADPIVHWLAEKRQLQYGSQEYQAVYDLVQMLIRKTAHFLEYMILGGLIQALVLSFRDRMTLPLSLSGSSLYAASDEIHQMLQGDRSGMIQDVLLDSCGAFAGILLGTWLLAGIRHRKEQKNRVRGKEKCL